MIIESYIYKGLTYFAKKLEGLSMTDVLVTGANRGLGQGSLKII